MCIHPGPESPTVDVIAWALAHKRQFAPPSVVSAVVQGLAGSPRALPTWLLYDDRGSELYHRIAIVVPEYYFPRVERSILELHAAQIVERASDNRPVSLSELGAGTASRTGILLKALASRQSAVSYRPVDISSSALRHARAEIDALHLGVTVRPQTADYTRTPLLLDDPVACGLRTLVL